MPGDRRKQKKWRLFVALDLPAVVRRGIERWGDSELADPALRRVGEESLHVTLAFLDWRQPEEAVPAVAAVRESAGSPAPLMELLAPVAKPSPKRPRLWALPVLSAGTEELQAELGARLVAAGLYEPEKRPFWPHVTVARVRGAGRGSGRRPAFAERQLGALPTALSEPFYGFRLTLYRSELQPTGVRYTSLAQVKLPGAGGSEVI